MAVALAFHYPLTSLGVSFVWSTDVGIEDIELVHIWGSGERTSGRVCYERLVPSRISYSPELAWGYDIDPGAKTYCRTKLLLDRFTQPSDFHDSSLNDADGPYPLLTPPGKTPEDVVTDFLALLYSHIMSLLVKKFGCVVERSPIDFWYTVPALWSLRAEDAMRNAALKSGFGSREKDSVHMIREPEAAAIACLSGKCGSTTIDRALHRLMEERFGSAFSSLPSEKKGGGTKFMNQFESAKRNFGVSKRARKYRLDLRLKAPDSEWYDGDYNEVIITTEDMRSLFDPVVKQIIALLEQHIQATMTESHIETICLVGGFGESLYLLNKLQDWCPPGVEILNPTRPWEAVCLGAALRGLQGPTMMKKKFGRHLETKIAKPFREGIDNKDNYYMGLFNKLI
ncbi:hypothetical protein FGADI_11010 [Fusarium gaditjirri]|uniref:Actin-like protein n=1 Tax=Fusarium gaditjirri TaxID=282569 RepID=A0A8H4SW84_9HYPO|nr:hypothetical protein FGADI_11010 [Fusarium gaditjirri]